jgi:hypothetical protein
MRTWLRSSYEQQHVAQVPQSRPRGRPQNGKPHRAPGRKIPKQKTEEERATIYKSLKFDLKNIRAAIGHSQLGSRSHLRRWCPPLMVVAGEFDRCRYADGGRQEPRS